jgi:SAM-dependent methyltransferase
MSDIHWTKFSDDPNNLDARAAVTRKLLQIRQLHTDTNLTNFVLAQVAGRRVLDIGFAEHAMNYFNRSDWRHAKISEAANYCLGIDIIVPMVKELSKRGYNVRCADATSEEDLGERFDVVFIGDVLEHVSDPSAMLRFAGRHLHSGGRIFASTPNPFSRKFIRQFLREGVMVVNLDHVSWITPTQAIELAQRANLDLTAYHLIKPMSQIKRYWKEIIQWRYSPAELNFPDYLYEFAIKT